VTEWAGEAMVLVAVTAIRVVGASCRGPVVQLSPHYAVAAVVVVDAVVDAAAVARAIVDFGMEAGLVG